MLKTVNIGPFSTGKIWVELYQKTLFGSYWLSYAPKSEVQDIPGWIGIMQLNQQINIFSHVSLKKA